LGIKKITKFNILYFLLLTLTANVLFCQDSNVAIRDTSFIYDNHPQDVPSNKGFYIHSSDGKSYVKIYGSVRMNGAFDLNGLQTKQTFSTYDIPVGKINSEKRFFLSPYQSRIGLEVKSNTFLGKVNMKIESDFLGSGNSLRIRHAYGVLNNFLIGQTWSVFGDPAAIPVTVDMDGPNSSSSERTVQLRYEYRNFIYKLALAIESPNPDLSSLDSTELEPVFQSYPDVSAHLKIKRDWGHAQLAGIFRSITVRNIDNTSGVLFGYGGLLSSIVSLKKRNYLYYQFIVGKGISRYIQGLTGKGQDVIFDSKEKQNQLLTSYGGFISLEHKWNKLLSSVITFGLLRVVNKDFQPDDAFKSSFYTSANVFFHIVEGSNLGVEYSLGTRINKNGESGKANRISFIGYLDF
jgi:hypothetical protein